MTDAKRDGQGDPLVEELARLAKQSNRMLSILQEVRALLDTPETDEDPITVMKRYLIWLFTHVGQIENRLESIDIGLQMLTMQLSERTSSPPLQPSSEPVMEAEDDADGIF